MQITLLKTVAEIEKAFDVFLELRPHLTSKEAFVTQVIHQQQEGYQILAFVEDTEIAAYIGFRFMTTLAWGKILYIDDLITREKSRGKGYGSILLDHVIQIAKDHLCDQIHLDTGYARHAAHKLYLNKGFELTCHHLALNLK